MSLFFSTKLSSFDYYVPFNTSLEGLPQMNYPYQIGQRPGWPVRAACNILLEQEQNNGNYNGNDNNVGRRHDLKICTLGSKPCTRGGFWSCSSCRKQSVNLK